LAHQSSMSTTHSLPSSISDTEASLMCQRHSSWAVERCTYAIRISNSRVDVAAQKWNHVNDSHKCAQMLVHLLKIAIVIVVVSGFVYRSFRGNTHHAEPGYSFLDHNPSQSKCGVGAEERIDWFWYPTAYVDVQWEWEIVSRTRTLMVKSKTRRDATCSHGHRFPPNNS
jgi:hypothetical protein